MKAQESHCGQVIIPQKQGMIPQSWQLVCANSNPHSLSVICKSWNHPFFGGHYCWPLYVVSWGVCISMMCVYVNIYIYTQHIYTYYTVHISSRSLPHKICLVCTPTPIHNHSIRIYTYWQRVGSQLVSANQHGLPYYGHTEWIVFTIKTATFLGPDHFIIAVNTKHTKLI